MRPQIFHSITFFTHPVTANTFGQNEDGFGHRERWCLDGKLFQFMDNNCATFIDTKTIFYHVKAITRLFRVPAGCASKNQLLHTKEHLVTKTKLRSRHVLYMRPVRVKINVC